MTRKLRRWRHSRLRWVVEYAAVQSIRALIAPMTLRGRLRAGHVIGDIAWAILPSRRRTTLENLKVAYPEETPEWRDAQAKKSFRHLGRLGVEVLFLDSKRNPAAVTEGWEHLEAVASGNRGYFLMSGHFGNWELLGNLQAAAGYPVSMITRPLDNPLLERLFSRVRETTGNRIIHKRSAVREMVKGLKAGEGIGIVIDQNFREKGAHFVPFFGVSAATTPILGAISVRMAVPIVPVFAFPLDDGSYRIRYEPAIYPPDGASGEEAAIAMTAEATKRIENAIRACPHPWFWMHNRWKTRPPVTVA